ncbi:hypothetical protein ACHWQZ_G000894 [Mnemiopsis leidyi]
MSSSCTSSKIVLFLALWCTVTTSIQPDPINTAAKNIKVLDNSPADDVKENLSSEEVMKESTTDSSEYIHCSTDDLNNGTIMPCSKDEDPFSETRDLIEDLWNGGREGLPYSDAYENRRLSWSSEASNEYDQGKVDKKELVVVPEKLSVKKRFVFVLPLKLIAVVKTTASVAKVVGPILNVVMIFVSRLLSPELKAIQAGFAETNAALDVLSLKLDQLEDKSDFNAILPILINFEASVGHGMEKYNTLATYLNNTEGDLKSRGKTLLEDLINYVRDNGDIGRQLQLITKHIVKGLDTAHNGEHLLSTFQRAENNDCSKIVPFGLKLLTLIQNAQKLQYIYELNQGIVRSTDDKGYPKDIYDIHVEIVKQYADCNKKAGKEKEIFNLRKSSKKLPCVEGHVIQLSPDGNSPFCLCNFGYGGDQCDVSLLTNPDKSLISSILDISEKYKVPGMFDLQKQIDAQTEKIMNGLEENKLEIITEVRSITNGLQKNKNTVLAAQSVILNQMKTETNKVLGGFANLRTAFEAALEKERYDRIMRSEKSTNAIVHSIVEVAQQITDKLVSLDRKTVENRYFDELSLHVPVFQRVFEYASSAASSEHMKEMFSQYLDQNKHYFYVAREALTHAVVGRPDSYLRAQMNGYMTSGCTEEYNEEIRSTWEMLLDLHSSTYVMEYWDMNYRWRKAFLSRDKDEMAAIEEQRTFLKEQLDIEGDLLSKEYDLSCPSFEMTQIVGGGCKEGFVFRGQTVKTIKCIEEHRSIVLKSSGALTEKIVCQDEGKWNVNIDDLICVQSCEHDGKRFVIGDTRKLPLPNIGFHWVDSDKEAVTESECLFNPHNNTAVWSHYEEEDIDECISGEELCGYHGSCINAIGSYTCNCDEGFVFNPGSGCEDVNECTVGGRGSISCMVSQQLGVCNNTEGSYECICLVGAYKSSNTSQECSPCPCEEKGVTSSFCDVKTGTCFCKYRVGEEGCKACQVGHFDFPTCKKCDLCHANGTTEKICDPETGSCLCKSFTYGERCDRCCPDLDCEDDYKPFPDCTAIESHGTLSSWTSWSGWSDLGRCDGYSLGYDQRRTRRRTCDDSTMTRHGRSCKNDHLEDSQERYRSVCKSVTGYAVHMTCAWTAGTYGGIQFGIRQNGIECHSYSSTISGPDRCRWYYRSGRQGCNKLFDTTKSIQIRILNNHWNNAYVDYFRVLIDGSYRYWRGSEKLIDHDSGRDWHWASHG